MRSGFTVRWKSEVRGVGVRWRGEVVVEYHLVLVVSGGGEGDEQWWWFGRYWMGQTGSTPVLNN